MNNKQREILLIAQEECAEVSQVISKIFRFGLDETYDNKTNRERLEEEVGDLVCMIELMQSTGLIDSEFLRNATRTKYSKLERWSTIFEEIQ
jgi:NTP pyrophosphatase (non-canonical NTP hydrolase)